MFFSELLLGKEYASEAIAVEHALSIDLQNAVLSQEGEPILDVNISFSPLRSMQVSTDLVLHKHNGGSCGEVILDVNHS